MTDQKVALVTGANRGIGLEVVKQLSSLNIRVILGCRIEQSGREAIQGFEYQKNITVKALNVNIPQQIKEVIGFIETEFGRLDIVVNNAGINYDTHNSSLNIAIEEIQQTMETNLYGPWRIAQAAIPLMKKNGYGRIVNISSESGALSGMGAGTPAYSVSKTAMNVMTIKLAHEVSEFGILVNSVCPGWVRTDMGGSMAPRSVTEGASGIVWAATLPDNGPNGGFFRDGKSIDW
ncbi:SDR family NAD(P)-dependent oxidoreductase [Reichenbachiella versicolor]|uniref:SDR family NAD(P)-dependent oxidoreductase n=1 Tax=Reichenbachiella versicolor TaxID=1821036 RepID=UPI000D6E8FB8|nr:SDR family NAD(P)-dependent oxidoreductase [Reichenbachiella versicolor]